MSLLYCTADQIGMTSGGGRVTQEESTALHDLGTELGLDCHIWGRQQLETKGEDPWKWDQMARIRSVSSFWRADPFPQLAHFYAGTFSTTIDFLKNLHCKISYTAAAHSIELSKREHERLGLRYDYPHLTQPDLWKRYVEGYLKADLVICPSQHSAACMRSYGCKNIKVIPHGVDIPDDTFPLPEEFRVGYLGAVGPDKGLINLLMAWKKLACPDAVLYLAGRDSQSYFVQELIRLLGVRNVELKGWVEDISCFFKEISLYVQPSITEGFGIEVLEAMAHGRAVLCSTGAGAADVVPETWRFPAGDALALADRIDQFRKADLTLLGQVGRGLAKDYDWAKIRLQYQNSWRGLL